jgi:succinyl-CoA synthetase alpha subunit
MSIFVNAATKVIVQGLTGGQGKYHGLRNRDYGTNVVAGVTPGKGGQEVEGIPVFDSVAEAVAATGADASFVAVPPKAAPAAILEAAAAGVGFVVCITEGIPAQDEAKVFNTLVRDYPGTRLLGPNCPGIISPGKCNIGITAGEIALPPSADGPNVGIVSRSGTLTYQALHELKEKGIGVSTCVGIGGDPVPGTNFIDCLREFEADPETHAIIMIGDIGDRDAVRSDLAGRPAARDNSPSETVELRGELGHPRLVEDGEQRGGHERNLDGPRVDVLYDPAPGPSARARRRSPPSTRRPRLGSAQRGHQRLRGRPSCPGPCLCRPRRSPRRDPSSCQPAR